jgi:formylglycine-generating enzyme required for sulfatase activity
MDGNGRPPNSHLFDGSARWPRTEYSADFFDGQHLVMKGASPATDASLLRRSFRNWFRPELPVRLCHVPLRADRD